MVLLIAYPYMYKENEAVVFDVEEDTKIRQEKLDGLVIYNIFQSKVEGIEIECDPSFGNDTSI